MEAPRRLTEAREGRTREERVLEVMSGPAAPTTYLHAIPETGHRGVLQITHVALIYPSYYGLQTHKLRMFLELEFIQAQKKTK